MARESAASRSRGEKRSKVEGLSIPAEKTFDSVDLKGVTVLATQGSPIPAGKSAIWCASFNLAWKRLSADVAKGPVRVRGAGDLCERLDREPVEEGDLPACSWYAAAGWVRDGIRERIRTEMAAAFPAAPAPELGGTDTGTIAVAYAYLEAAVKFEIPFFQSREPFEFRSSSGTTARVTAFGIGKEDHAVEWRIRDQTEVLYAAPGLAPTEYVIDPCRSSAPVQVVLARIPRKSSLAETVAGAEEKISRFRSNPNDPRLHPNDVLLIPEVLFEVRHRFLQLEGKRRPILNAGLESSWIEPALQSIRFRLDRSGVRLESKASMWAVLCAPRDFLFDRPFLVYLKKRGGGRPFFAMWIDDPELLCKWR